MLSSVNSAAAVRASAPGSANTFDTKGAYLGRESRPDVSGNAKACGFQGTGQCPTRKASPVPPPVPSPSSHQLQYLRLLLGLLKQARENACLTGYKRFGPWPALAASLYVTPAHKCPSRRAIQ